MFQAPMPHCVLRKSSTATWGCSRWGKRFLRRKARWWSATLVAAGEQVFLDLKFHDIPNTVRAAAQPGGDAGCEPADRPRLRRAQDDGSGRGGCSRRGEGNGRGAAHAGAGGHGPDQPERGGLGGSGIPGSPEEVVVRLARLAQAAGADGVVASPREIAAIRQACGPDFLIVTPGIRPAAGAGDDQARTATPASAIRAGADYLVIGRPITGAADPAAAADAIAAEMEKALALTSPLMPQRAKQS